MSASDAGEEFRAGGLSIPARTIPAPLSVSPEAQAILSGTVDLPFSAGPTDLDDKDAWREFIDGTNAALAEIVSAAVAGVPAKITEHRISQTFIHEIVPESLEDEADDRALLYLHGGGFIFNPGLTGAHMGLPLCSAAKIRTFSVDYRMPPDHPYPAGLEDCVEAYRWLLERHAPEKIAVYGISAGAGLAASFLLKAGDEGLPMPASCVLATPASDLTESGDTFATNDTIDVVLKHRMPNWIALYADGHDLTHPYLSPIFGDFSKGFPPAMLTSGTRDLLLSNTVLLHRALLNGGVTAELHVWEAMPHGGFLGPPFSSTPEDQEVLHAQVEFIVNSLKD